MEKSNILTAPQVPRFSQLYDKWKGTHIGSSDDFYRFMTVPSVSRDTFVRSLGVELSFDRGIYLQNLITV